jgi:hypothetical protein
MATSARKNPVWLNTILPEFGRLPFLGRPIIRYNWQHMLVSASTMHWARLRTSGVSPWVANGRRLWFNYFLSKAKHECLPKSIFYWSALNGLSDRWAATHLWVFLFEGVFPNLGSISCHQHTFPNLCRIMPNLPKSQSRLTSREQHHFFEFDSFVPVAPAL